MASAEGILQKLIEQYQLSPHNKKPEWAKIHAYSVEKEADVVLNEQHEHELQLLKEEPASSTTFPEMVRVSETRAFLHNPDCLLFLAPFPLAN